MKQRDDLSVVRQQARESKFLEASVTRVYPKTRTATIRLLSTDQVYEVSLGTIDPSAIIANRSRLLVYQGELGKLIVVAVIVDVRIPQAVTLSSLHGGTRFAVLNEEYTEVGSIDSVGNLYLAGNIVAGGNMRRLGDVAMDFTGTDLDTKAECEALGLRFSDSRSATNPFAQNLFVYTHNGTWTHSAGNGWQPASVIDNQGPALLFPLCWAENWEALVEINYNPLAVADRASIRFGYATPSNHCGAMGEAVDNVATTTLTAALWTNDGDDTWTSRWSGVPYSGSGTRIYKFRCQNGAVGIWDCQDSAWHWYEGRQSIGISYTPAYFFLQVYKITGFALSRLYLRRFELTYLL